MIKGFFFGILLSFAVLAAYLVHHLGMFKTVEIREENRGPFYVIYENHKGPYFQISDQITEVEKHTKEMGLECDKTFGQFFDDPNNVDEDRLRSRGGCLSSHEFQKWPERMLKDTIPQGRFVVAEFSGSPAIGPWKVYPKIQKYIEEHRLVSASSGSIEIYTLQNDSFSTEYLQPIKEGAAH